MGKWRMVVRGGGGLALATLALAVGGCELLYLAGGQGKQKALYKFPKDQRVLVLVDVRTEVAAPPYLASNLADSVSKHLWKYHAVEKPVVSQDAVVSLQARDPDAFKKLGVQDIAEATGADSVLQVYITQFMTPTTTDGSVAEGYAEAYVKVVDKKGNIIFGGKPGIHLVAHDQEALVSDRDISKTVVDLIEQISLQTGRIFHDYNVEDKDMNPSHLNPNRQMGRPGQ
ncbi:MAG TPA: hypothetical protein VHM90_06845 [Phycisphaerae bacterium]|jgi:hypothetical protein|nr:hypothetical protein [Phycisphaerae bacterium]